MARPVNRIPVPAAGARSEVCRLIIALAATAATAAVVAVASPRLALPVVLVGRATPVAGHSQRLIGGTPR
jgi:hypothetical protein